VQIEELSVVKNTKDDGFDMIEPIKEYQLKNHLPGSGTSNPEAAASIDNNEMSLAHDDFQLFEALKILRTMRMLSSNSFLTTGN
jgi:hypothetical protein